MSIETAIVLVIAFALGWSIGAVITTVRTARAFQSILKDLGVTTEQLLKLRDRIEQEDEADTPRAVIEIRLEQDQGMIYAYRKDNSQFLAQGTDQEALIDHLNHTFANGARLLIKQSDGSDLLQKNNA